MSFGNRKWWQIGGLRGDIAPKYHHFDGWVRHLGSYRRRGPPFVVFDRIRVRSYEGRKSLPFLGDRIVHGFEGIRASPKERPKTSLPARLLDLEKREAH